MALSIKASNLHETSIFSKTNGEHFLRDDPCIEHGLIYRLLVLCAQTFTHAEAEDAISRLVIKQIGLLADASETKLKVIEALMEL